jgi:hypothetical protein
LDIRGVETKTVFITEKSFWRCKLIKNDGRFALFASGLVKLTPGLHIKRVCTFFQMRSARSSETRLSCIRISLVVLRPFVAHKMYLTAIL